MTAVSDETGRESLARLIQERVARLNKTRRTLGFNRDDALSLAMLVYDNAAKIIAALSAAPVAIETGPVTEREYAASAAPVEQEAALDECRKQMSRLREQQRVKMNLAGDSAERAASEGDMSAVSINSTESERHREAFSALNAAIAEFDKLYTSAPVAQEPVIWQTDLSLMPKDREFLVKMSDGHYHVARFIGAEKKSMIVGGAFGFDRTEKIVAWRDINTNPPATSAGVGASAEEIARVFVRWKQSKNLHERLAAQSIEKELLALLSRGSGE